MRRKEAVDHPAHYGGGDNPYEAIKVIEAWNLDFCTGNTVKYIARAPHKGVTLEDYKKARWYLDRKIQQMEQALEKARRKKVQKATYDAARARARHPGKKRGNGRRRHLRGA